MSKEEDVPEPWLPLPVIAALMLASIVAGAVGFVAIVDSPAAAMTALHDPVFYVLLAVAGGAAVAGMLVQHR